jgi:poly(3-hydroxybutyrate) depolymerase
VRVEFRVDAAVRAAVSTAPYAWPWDTSTETPGEHTLSARAVGRDGRVAEATLRVTVTPTSPPAP